MQIKKANILNILKQVFSLAAVFMIICGLFYPLFLTGIAQVIFPYQAEGSLIEVNGKAVAAEHVGQEFLKDYYLWSRPSAYHYNVYTEDKEGKKLYSDHTEFLGLASGSQNYAPSNPELSKRVEQDLSSFLRRNPQIQAEDIPADLLTASGSGLDPHISPRAAEIQVPRIIKASGLAEETLREIIKQNTQGKLLGIFGEARVNVVQVNIAIAKEMGLLD